MTIKKVRYMNLTISSTNLLKALMDVSKAIPSKSPLPILENFLFVPGPAGGHQDHL